MSNNPESGFGNDFYQDLGDKSNLYESQNIPESSTKDSIYEEIGKVHSDYPLYEEIPKVQDDQRRIEWQ